ncbi:MAG: TraC family protein [Candidatus Parcubacteria bacterium]|nr:TraC family protein [Candidatus Parcubacteria bacterium]
MPAPVQKYLQMAEFRDDIVIMHDGTLRAVLMCSSVNFALKGEDEQNALISSYMQFLNSLDHPLQIVIQSRKLDIEGYIRRLKEAEKLQQNELLRNQIAGYIDYIGQLIEMNEIMTKKFFVVVPFHPAGSKKQRSFFTRVQETLFPVEIIKVRKEVFSKYKEELMLRVNNIRSNLQSMGIDSVALDTQGLIELYYNCYNPTTSQNQKIKDLTQFNLER